MTPSQISHRRLPPTPERLRDIERLRKVAVRVAVKAGVTGITMPNLRRAGVAAGILTGGERRLDWLAAVLAGTSCLVQTQLSRPSDIPAQNRIPRRVYVHEAFYRRSLHGPKLVRRSRIAAA